MPSWRADTVALRASSGLQRRGARVGTGVAQEVEQHLVEPVELVEADGVALLSRMVLARATSRLALQGGVSATAGRCFRGGASRGEDEASQQAERADGGARAGAFAEHQQS